MLLRLAYLAVTNTFTLLRLLPMSERDKDIEILALRHQLLILQRQAGKPAFTDYDYSNFYYGAGDDPLNLLPPFTEWYREARPNGYYLYPEPLESAPTTKVRVRSRRRCSIISSPRRTR